MMSNMNIFCGITKAVNKTKSVLNSHIAVTTITTPACESQDTRILGASE